MSTEETLLVSDEEIAVGAEAFREMLVESGYSSFVSDEQCVATATRILLAAAKVRRGHN